MRSSFLLFLFVILFLSFGCKTTSQSNIEIDYSKEGYVKAKVKSSKINKSACSPLILVNGKEDDYLDAVNFDNYLKNQKVDAEFWIKFVSLRMKNRCSNARPISIMDIKKGK